MEINKIKKSIEQSFTVLQKIKSFGNEKDLQAGSETYSHFHTQSMSQ